MEELAWTGERLVTSISELHGTIEHLHRYALALKLAKNKTVLDIASGEGYGTNLLSKLAKKAIGVDISEEAVHHARLKYNSDNLEFKVGSTSKIPLPDKSVDLVVSFETIEHHDEHEEMMTEIKRVLVPNGILIISSPEKSIYKARDPNNPYHIKELSLLEFRSLLEKYFDNVHLFDQKFIFGSLISKIGDSKGFEFFDGNFDNITNDIDTDEFYNRSFFNLAVASNSDSTDSIPGSSVFNGLKVLHKETQKHDLEIGQLNARIELIRQSKSYRIGNFLVGPLSFLKRK